MLRPLRQDYFFTVFATHPRDGRGRRSGPSEEAPELIRSLLPLRDQLPGSLSATLALQPVALTLGELCRLAGREDEARSHFAHAETGRRALGVAALGCAAARRSAGFSRRASRVQAAGRTLHGTTNPMEDPVSALPAPPRWRRGRTPRAHARRCGC